MKLINKVRSNFLLRLASLNSINVFIRFVFGLITTKVIAIFVGVEGMAFIGNLRNFLTTVQTFSVFGLSNGVVKFVSQYRNDKKELQKILSSVLILAAIATLLVSIIIYINKDYFNKYLFGNENLYSFVLTSVLLATPFVTLNIICLAVIKGFSKFKKYLHINIFSQCLSIVLSLFLIYKFKLEGALLALVFGPAIIFISTLLFLFKNKIIVSYFNFRSFKKEHVKSLVSFSVMSMFTAFFLPLITIEIRNYIIDNVDTASAGYWEAMQRISRYYLMFVSSLVSLYIFPKFSSFTLSTQFRNEVWDFYKTIMPLFAIGLIVIYFSRSFIITFVFTEEFLPTQELFLWQLLGDFVRVLTMVISFQLLAKKMIWHYLITETISIISLYFLSIYFINIYGVKGATFAHFINFCMYFLMIVFVFRKLLFNKRPLPI